MKPQTFRTYILILCVVLGIGGISFGQEEGGIGAAMEEQLSDVPKQTEARVAALKEQLAIQEKSFRKFLEELSAQQKQAEAQIEIFKGDLLQSQKSLNEKESKIIALTALIDNLKTKNKNLQRTIILKEQFSDVPKQTKTRVAALKKQLETQKESFKRELGDVRKQSEIQLETLKKNLQQSQNSIGVATSINNLKVENDNLKKQLFDAQGKLSEVQAEYEKVLSTKEKEMSVFNATLGRREKEKKAVEVRLMSLQKELKELKNAKELSQRPLSGVQKQAEAQRIISEKEKKISELSAAVEEMRAKKLSLQVALDNSQQYLKEKERKLFDMHTAFDSSAKNKRKKARVLTTASRELLFKPVFELKEKQKEIDRLNKFAKKRDTEARLAEKKLVDFQEKVQKERLSLHYNLGVVYDKNAMYLDALKEYEKALAVGPNDADTYYNLAILYDDHLNDNRAAIRHYQKYLTLRPDADDVEQVIEWVIRAERELGITKPCKAEKPVGNED